MPLPISPENLDALIDALERFAVAMPPGHALFTAIYDTAAEASDLIIRDQDGDTRLILGLEGDQHDRLGALLAWVRGDLDRESLLREAAAAWAVERPRDGAAQEARPGEELSTVQAGELDYRGILEHSPLPLMVADRAGTIEFASPAVVRRLGMRDPKQLTGMSLSEVVHPADRAMLSTLVAELGAEEETMHVKVLRWDGLYLHAEITARLMSGTERIVLALTPWSGQSAADQGFGVNSSRRRWQMGDGAQAGGPAAFAPDPEPTA